MNDMDKLFGGGEESPKNNAATPEPQKAGRQTIAQTAAAVSRRRRESNRTALIHETLLIIGTLLLVGGSYFAFRAYLRHKAELEERRHENAMAEKARAEEAMRRLREETAAHFQREREKREREVAEQRRRQEEKRAAQEKARSQTARFREVKDVMRGATIDYFRNADDAERPGKVDGEATFLCLFPGGEDGCAFYEVRTVPGQKPAASRLSENKPPVPLPEEEFSRLAATKPYLILRERGKARQDVKAYLVSPSKTRRAAKNIPVPEAAATFSPAKADLGELYDAVHTLGISRLAFKYRVTFSAKELVGGVVLPQILGLDETITRAAVANAVKRDISERARKDRYFAKSLPSVDKLLEKGTLSFTAVR